MAEVRTTCASLRLFGDDLDPSEISTLLGCLPTQSEKKGELKGPRRNIVARTGGWRLSSEREHGDCLDRQVLDLLRATTSDLSVWKFLHGRFKVDMFCGVWLDEPNQGLLLDPETLAELGRRDIRLGLDIYAEAEVT